jgi:hypothetical protein
MPAEGGAMDASDTVRGQEAWGCAGALPLALNVGFSGNRALDSNADLGPHLDEAFALAAEAARRVLQTPLPEGFVGAAYDGGPHLRLLIGAAPGADRHATARWTAAAHGEIHYVFPYRDPEQGGPITDRPEHVSDEIRADLPDGGGWTGFDAYDLGLEQSQGHAEVARWIVRHADVLVAAWDGKSASGAGGTGDTLRRALERGAPVLWVRPGEPVRMVDPALAHRHADLTDAESLLALPWAAASAEALAALLAGVLAPPGGGRLGLHDPEVAARLDYARIDPLRRRTGPLGVADAALRATLWRAYHGFERLAGGASAGKATHAATPPPPDALTDQPGFDVLSRALHEAAARASHLSAIHRSQQLLLILIATAAVAVGASPTMWRLEPGAHRAHWIAALVEFGLGAAAFLIALAARRAHRHRRWSDARRLAERLRGARATWPLGVDVADSRVAHPQTWTEWRALAVLRLAGPRRGWIDRESFAASARWTAAELIDGQIAYHTRQYQVAETIERTIRITERFAFGFLMTVLAAYIALGIGNMYGRWSVPDWVSGLLTIVSAVSPAIGAACLALEATSGFGELALRSERLAREFEKLKDQLDAAPPPYRQTQDLARAGAQLLVEDADAWRDRVARRRIVQGG